MQKRLTKIQMIHRLQKFLQEITATPLIQISERIYAKDESMNRTGSIKIRMACWVILQALIREELDPGMIVFEATSGNSGIALAYICKKIGLQFIAIMPENMTKERVQMIQKNKGTVIFVGTNDFAGAVIKRDSLVEHHNGFTPNQFENPDNVQCHYEMTGAEILSQLQVLNPSAVIDFWVAGTGTGGTLMGVQKRLLCEFPELITVAIEPEESRAMHAFRTGTAFVAKPHAIGGIGDGFIPKIVDMSLVDGIQKISSPDAIRRTILLNAKLDLQVGISSGANVLAAENIQRKYRSPGCIVTVLSDNINRYASIL